MGGDQGDEPWVAGSLPSTQVDGEGPGLQRRATIAMPTEPMRASGLRPIRSTKIIAITVPTMLMIDVVKE